MRLSSIAILLYFLLPYAVVAQQTGSSANTKAQSKRTLTVKELNQLEMEKIQSLSIFNKPAVKDSVIIIADIASVSTDSTKDTLNNIASIKDFKNNSIDSIVRKAEPITVLDSSAIEITETQPVAVTKLSKEDSIQYAVFEKNKRFADSVRRVHKPWLDSTLSALPKSKPVILNKDDEIEIFISGGGLYTGINPTIYDRLTIYNSGLIHRASKTKLQGESSMDKKISKDRLQLLAQYIIDQGFFDFNNLYDCEAKDKACHTRLKTVPEPTPLTVVVSIGTRRKKIYVALYAPRMESNWVNYPKNLERIVNAIYEVSE